MAEFSRRRGARALRILRNINRASLDRIDERAATVAPARRCSFHQLRRSRQSRHGRTGRRERTASLRDAARHFTLVVLLDVRGEPAGGRVARRAISGAASDRRGLCALVRRDHSLGLREHLRGATRASSRARARRERRLPVQLEDVGGECVGDEARTLEWRHRDRPRARPRIRDVRGRY